jgi:hypothetical protein
LKGSPSTQKLPSAAKEIKKEESSATHSGEVEGPGASAGGSHQATEATLAKDESNIPATTENELVAVSSSEIKPTEGFATNEENTVVAEPVPATDKKVDADEHAEQPVAAKDYASNAEAAKPLDTESSAAEPVVPEEPEKPTSTQSEVADITEDHTATNEVSEQSNEELD